MCLGLGWGYYIVFVLGGDGVFLLKEEVEVREDFICLNFDI